MRTPLNTSTERHAQFSDSHLDFIHTHGSRLKFSPFVPSPYPCSCVCSLRFDLLLWNWNCQRSAQCRCSLPPKGTNSNNGKSVNTVRWHFHQLLSQLRSGARNTRCGMVSSRMIVGTPMTCSATTGSVTKNLTTSDNWSTICGTGTSIIGTGTKGLDDRLHGCAAEPVLAGPATSGRGGGRPTPSSSSKTSKNSASLPLAVFWPVGRCTECAPPTLLLQRD